MNTWTSKVRAFATVLILLAGCDEIGGQAPQTRPVALAGGDIVVTPPPGYCVDRKSVRRGTASSFALLARCDALASRKGSAARDPVLITVTTEHRGDTGGQPGSEAIERAAAPARVTAKRKIKALPVLRLQDPGHRVAGASPQVWRTAFAVNGHVVAMALYASEDNPMLGERGARMLAEMAADSRASSATIPADPG